MSRPRSYAETAQISRGTSSAAAGALMRTWLILALGLVLFPGCFASHGREGRGDGGGAIAIDGGWALDAEAPTDAGTCPAVPTTVTGLRCPEVIAPGDTAVVEATHSLSECCSPAGARVVASRTSTREVDLTTTWDSCECCEECDCSSPPAMQAIGIGMFDAGPITVRAGELTCTIEVRALACRAASVDEAHAPMTVAIGEPIPVLVRANAGVSCGCSPHAIERVGREGGEYAGIEVCECDDSDPCVDSGYEATAVFAPGTRPSARAISSDAAMVGVEVVDRSQCAPGTIRVRSIRIEAPSERLIGEQPAGYWAVLDAEARYCCTGPRSLVEPRATTSPFEIGLEVLDCVEADCDCEPGAPTVWEHWHYLGPLAPGDYTLSAGTATTTFAVP